MGQEVSQLNADVTDALHIRQLPQLVRRAYGLNKFVQASTLIIVNACIIFRITNILPKMYYSVHSYSGLVIYQNVYVFLI
jgi:hypothetical protein